MNNLHQKHRRVILSSLSLLGILTLWLADRLWRELNLNDSRWTLFWISVAVLGSGATAGLAISLVARVRPSLNVMWAVWPFVLVTLHWWYWLSPLPFLFSGDLLLFLMREPVLLSSFAVVGVVGGSMGASAIESKRATAEALNQRSDERRAT